MMGNRLMLDTEVIVDYLRGHGQAAEFLESRPETLMVSAITVAELFAGVRDGRERTALSAFLGAFEVVSISRGVAERAGLHRRDFGKSHNTGLADALIAAATQDAGARLVTLNSRHFPMLPDVLIPYRKP